MPFKTRQICLWIHRYTGLTMAVFLFMAGITGALLAFHDELDDVFNHELAYVETQNVPQFSIAELHDKVQASYPQYPFSSMPVEIEPEKSAVFVVDRVRGQKMEAPFQEVYVNPYSGEVIGTRNKDEWALRNTMWKVFWLHRDLLLGDIGKLTLGIVALVWTLNCFIGFYLTLPRAVRQKKTQATALGPNNKPDNKPVKKRASLFKRWLPAWKIRRKSNFFKLNYDVHQALGLWLWVMLFVIAWSSVAFNLPQVYQPVMKAAIGLEARHRPQQQKPQRAVQAEETKPAQTESLNKSADMLSVPKDKSIDYLTQQANLVSKKEGVTVQQLLGLRWVAEDKQWQMRFKTNKDLGKKGGVSSITVDAVTGNVLRTNFGHQSSTASKTNEWLMILHMGHVGHGLSHVLYQTFLALVGLAVSILSFTGTYLWWKGRCTRRRRALKVNGL